jgi:hypothetical protein
VSFGGSKERQLIVAEHFLLTLILPVSLCGPTSGNDEGYAHVVSLITTQGFFIVAQSPAWFTHQYESIIHVCTRNTKLLLSR